MVIPARTYPSYNNLYMEIMKGNLWNNAMIVLRKFYLVEFALNFFQDMFGGSRAYDFQFICNIKRRTKNFYTYFFTIGNISTYCSTTIGSIIKCFTKSLENHFIRCYLSQHHQYTRNCDEQERDLHWRIWLSTKRQQ